MGVSVPWVIKLFLCLMNLKPRKGLKITLDEHNKNVIGRNVLEKTFNTMKKQIITMNCVINLFPY